MHDTLQAKWGIPSLVEIATLIDNNIDVKKKEIL
jgi:hypothetical protein